MREMQGEFAAKRRKSSGVDRLAFSGLLAAGGGTTPVDIKRVRKVLKTGEMEESRCAKECVTA
jgi:hypothetical protein